MQLQVFAAVSEIYISEVALKLNAAKDKNSPNETLYTHSLRL